MARGDLSITINSETKAFKQGVQTGIIAPLEDAEKALDALGKSSGPAGLEGDLRDAQKRTEQLADETKATARQIERSYREAGRDIKKGVGDGLDEAKNEAKQSGREAAASFSGEFGDVQDFIQETAANAFGGFGPLGAAAGIAAAAGLGVVGAAIQAQQEDAQRLKEYLAGAYQAAAEEGRKYIDAATIVGEANDILFNPDRVGEYNQAQKDAIALGIDTNTLIRARAGDQEALNTVIAATSQAQDDLKSKTEEAGSNAIRLSLDERNELERIQGRYEDIGKLHEENAQRAIAAQEIRDGLHEEERAQIDRTAAASQARYEALAARASGGIPVNFIPNTAAVDNYMSILQRRASQGITVNLRPGQGRTWE